MHFGRPYSAIDSGSSDALGQLSLRDYGKQAAQRYQASANVCAPFTNTNTAQSPARSSAKGLGNQIEISGLESFKHPIPAIVQISETAIVRQIVQQQLGRSVESQCKR